MYLIDLFETQFNTLNNCSKCIVPKGFNHISLTEPYPIGFYFSFLIHFYVEVYKEGSTKRESYYPLNPLRESYYPSSKTEILGKSIKALRLDQSEEYLNQGFQSHLRDNKIFSQWI